ncbi:MAG: hypothetical protein ACK4H7_05010, partial [Acidilobaceae archaeon]
MTWEEALAYAREHYRRYYASRVSLRLSDDNVNEAFYVYQYAVLNELPRRRAIIDFYGYRYRRMENFLREIHYYSPPAWQGVRTLCKPKQPKHLVEEEALEFMTPDEVERFITEVFITDPETGYVKPKVKGEKRRWRPKKTIIYLDLEIETCKP